MVASMAMKLLLCARAVPALRVVKQDAQVQAKNEQGSGKQGSDTDASFVEKAELDAQEVQADSQEEGRWLWPAPVNPGPADYESRPPASAAGGTACTNYQDTLPGAALGGQSHTVVMSLRFGYENPSQRQWILNIGQNYSTGGGRGAHHWLYNEGGSNYGETGGRFSIQFGEWSGAQIKVGDIQHACKTLATVYDAPTKTYSIYVDGKLKLTRTGVNMNIQSGNMNVGTNAAHPGDVNFDGCVLGVNVYRKALSAAEVLKAAEQLDSAWWWYNPWLGGVPGFPAAQVELEAPQAELDAQEVQADSQDYSDYR